MSSLVVAAPLNNVGQSAFDLEASHESGHCGRSPPFERRSHMDLISAEFCAAAVAVTAAIDSGPRPSQRTPPQPTQLSVTVCTYCTVGGTCVPAHRSDVVGKNCEGDT